MTTPSLVVLGPGAIGGLVAALLEKAGHPVTVVGRPTSVAQVAAAGIAVESDRVGSWQVRPAAATEVSRGARVVVAVKAEGLAAAAAKVAAAEPVEVVSLLNGVEHLDVLRAAAPAAFVVGGTIAGEVLRTSVPGDGPLTVRHRGQLLRVAAPDGAQGLETVRALQDTAADVVVDGTQAEVLWRKLRFLAPMALLTSRGASSLGDALVRDPAATDGLLAEIAAVAMAEGVPTTGAELREILDGFPPTMRSSLQADVEAGNPGELDAIGGAVLRRGLAHGIACPALARTVAEIAEIAEIAARRR
ncbi:ketopantoate reductase family protein [Xylanimonas protaetiae]|uniref:Ketopantoate reductase family protein n=1 Tax=Xylanimonas protaetiae TaxID=2509457 RepID=A0A4V0YGK5_9MICO|nr:2-dehydropantoate 2-reductase N-terminal domain-containing protein [Xylanimonas protaetiae]QAY71531.1 ketopantoate reductase family protein [Xylanimonas protaetiae]